MFQPDRAIEVTSPLRGSAYRIGGRLVLTAKHLVETGAIAQVKDQRNFGTVQAAIAWVAKDADIALLELPDEIESVESVQLGQLPPARTGETIDFQMYGWPQWGTTLRENDKRAAGGRQVDGIIYLADTSPDGLLVIEPQRIPFGVSSAGSDWSGMSGAAVICDGLVIAVQSAHHNPRRPQAATPLSAIAQDWQWQSLLQKHGIEAKLAIAQTEIKEPRIEPPFFFPPAIGSSTFVGRNHELDQLHHRLQTSNQVAISAISGMGGVGKTELAWQYAHRYQSHYPAGIWWVNASRITLEALTLSVRMHLPEPPDSLQSDVTRMQWVYQQWLERFPQGLRLLVCDDVDDYQTLRSLLPRDNRFRVLLTTRLQLAQPVQRVDLDVLKKAPAFRLLRELVNDDSRVAQEVNLAKQLTEWVGRLPLGIELIGRHLANHPSLALSKLLERLEQQKIKAKALQQRYPVNLQAAFEVSWNSLDESARQLAGLLSVFEIASIDRQWVTDCLKGWDEEAIEEAEAQLINRSLTAFENGRFLLHTLLHRFFQLKLDTELEATAEKLKQNGLLRIFGETLANWN